MESLLDAIRVAVSAGASDLERARGAAACRTLAEHLQPDPEPDPPPAPSPAAPPPVPLAPPTAPVSTLAALAPVSTPAPASVPNPFAGLGADQILDLVIAKLRHTAGPTAPAAPAGQPLQIHLVPIPRGPR